MTAITRCRLIWISDTHVGSRGRTVDVLPDFLHHNESLRRNLVGEIVDGCRPFAPPQPA
jgi:UDP-2,3-diacylglucosamine pyrophosphatase LpxH